MTIAATGWSLALLTTLVAAVLVAPAVGAQAAGCPEPNDEPSMACPLANGAAIESFIERPGDIDSYSFVLGAPGSVQLDLTSLPADYDLYLVDAGGEVIGRSVQEGTASERFEVDVKAGSYYVYVLADPARAADRSRPYTLRFSVTDAVALSAPIEPIESMGAERRILLRDTFDDSTKGYFPTGAIESGALEREYVDGEYRIRNFDPLNRYRGMPLPGVYRDLTISVDVRLEEASAGRLIAIECRKQVNDPDPFVPSSYKLWIYPTTGEFEITRSDGGRRLSLVKRQTASAIQRDEAWNHLELICHGTTISARANGQDLGSVEDGAYREGLSTITFGGPASAVPHVTARLDNLVVYGP